VRVAGSNPVVRSKSSRLTLRHIHPHLELARMGSAYPGSAA
jgi:hypothetical protein